MMLGEVVTDSDADLATLAAINCDKGRLCGIVVEDGVCLRTILSTEPTSGFATDGLVDMGDKIQGISPLR